MTRISDPVFRPGFVTQIPDLDFDPDFRPGFLTPGFLTRISNPEFQSGFPTRIYDPDFRPEFPTRFSDPDFQPGFLCVP
jgi:hypothetical protein